MMGAAHGSLHYAPQPARWKDAGGGAKDARALPNPGVPAEILRKPSDCRHHLLLENAAI